MINIDMFSLVEMSKSVNLIPYVYGRLIAMGLFTPRPITTRTVVIERQHNVLRLLGTQPRGSDGKVSEHGKRDALTFSVPYIPLTDLILPEEYAGKRLFGSDDQLETEQTVMLRKLTNNRIKFEITWEYLRWGALKGIIYDADGSTVLCNLFTAFGYSQETFDFALDNDATDVSKKCRELSRYMEMHLEGDVSTGTHVFVASDFFDALVAHPMVDKYFLNWQAAAQAQGKDPRKSFTFEGITFEDCMGQATKPNGETVKFVADGQGHAIPLGTMSTFDWYMAPGDFLETVNTPGVELYAKAKLRDYEKGVDIHMESNVLPMCTRPKLLPKLTK